MSYPVLTYFYITYNLGARPKEPRPDLVPSTPPLGGEASGYTPSVEVTETSDASAENAMPAKSAFRLKQQSKSTTAVSDDQASLSDINIQTEGSGLAMQELERKLSAAHLEQNIDYTQRWERVYVRLGDARGSGTVESSTGNDVCDGKEWIPI